MKKPVYTLKKFLIFFGYCLPAFVALALTIPGYYFRAFGVAEEIKAHARAVDSGKLDMSGLESGTDSKNGHEISSKEKKLIEFMLRHKETGEISEIINKVDEKIFIIWLRNSIFIIMMTILPFAILGVRVAFREKRSDISPADRKNAITSDWWMKFFVAYTMAMGWLYTINPQGRGGSTMSEYVNTQDVFTDNTLPGFIMNGEISLVIAGFLGWYLNLVSYFISKLYYDDVFGTRVYRFLVGKLFFVYGISLVMSSITIDQSKMAAFLIGYFPLTALSVLKEVGVKALQGGAQEKGSLAELPSISRSQILRLHEEGIENITTLASYRRIDDLKKYQHSLAAMVDLWIDYARLYAVMGQEDLLKMKGLCSTASEFLRRFKSSDFRNELAEAGIKNPDEIARLISETFSFDLELAKIAPGALVKSKVVKRA